MPTSMDQLLRVSVSTLPKYLGRPGDPRRLINEAAPRTLFGAKLASKTDTKWNGGTTWKFPLQFNSADIGQWTSPGQKLDFRGTRPPTYGSVSRRIYRWAGFIAAEEIDQNMDSEVVLYDLMRQAKEDAELGIITALDTAIMARDGNYLHDGDSDYLKPFGWRYWFTIDGLHITGDTTKLVGGINPNTQVLWKNPYISPVAAADNGDPIKTIYDLRKALFRAFSLMRFASIQGFGMGDNIKNAPSGDPRKGKLGPYGVVVDTRTITDYAELLFNRDDNVTGNSQDLAYPQIKGVPIEESESLGLNSYGYGKDPDTGTALWTDRAGSYANGNWANCGEALVYNTELIHWLTHKDHDPAIRKPYQPEGMEGVAYEGSYWCASACRSRRRGGCYIGPFAYA